MPIRYDKANKCLRFEFDRYIAGVRHRTSRLLPKGWTRAQAHKFDRTETARLYAVASGIEQPARLIDDAVLVYLQERGPELKNRRNLEIQLAVCLDAYTGRAITDLPAVAREYATDQADILAPGTIRNRIAYLRAACRYAWKRHGYCEHDPAARLVLAPVNNAKKDYLSRQQMLRVVRLIPNRYARAAARIAFYTGMRQAEICRARVLDGAFALDDTKNGLPRIVPMNPKLAGIARKLWPLKITTWTISHHFTKAARQAGIEGVTFHSLRHSTATAMVNAGIDLFTVGRVLGHKSQQSTARYAHHSTATLRDALATVGQKSPHKAPVKSTRKRRA